MISGNGTTAGARVYRRVDSLVKTGVPAFLLATPLRAYTLTHSKMGKLWSGRRGSWKASRRAAPHRRAVSDREASWEMSSAMQYSWPRCIVIPARRREWSLFFSHTSTGMFISDISLFWFYLVLIRSVREYRFCVLRMLAPVNLITLYHIICATFYFLVYTLNSAP